MLDEFTLASAVKRRSESCSFDISREKTATGIPSKTATFLAIFKASAVFPILGRAAKIIRSEGCKPDVKLSK